MFLTVFVPKENLAVTYRGYRRWIVRCTYVGSTRNFFIEGHGVQGLKLGRDGSQLMHESTFGLYLLQTRCCFTLHQWLCSKIAWPHLLKKLILSNTFWYQYLILTWLTKVRPNFIKQAISKFQSCSPNWIILTEKNQNV